MGKVLNYGHAYYYAKHSTRYNKLRIEVDARLNWGDDEYHTFAPHPREQTFQDDGRIYSGMLEVEKGASFITFIVDHDGNKSVLARRYDYPTTVEVWKQEVGGAPYDGPRHLPPEEVDADELLNTADILAAADAGRKIVAVVEYVMYGAPVRVEFPVRVLNINPDPAAPVGKQWQIASGEVGIVVPSTNANKRIKPAYVAFGRVGADVTVSTVYLDDVLTPRQSQDFSVAWNITPASARLYAIAEAPAPVQKTIVFAGDSVTQGSLVLLPPPEVWIPEEETFAHLIGTGRGFNNIINAGISGSTVASLKARLNTDVLPYAPAPVVIMIGINDVTAVPTPTPVATFRADLSEIVDTLKTAGCAVTIMSPNLVRDTAAGAIFPDYLAAMAEVAEEKATGFVPIYDLFCREFMAVDTTAWDALFYDTKHPSAAGHAFIASKALSAAFDQEFPLAS